MNKNPKLPKIKTPAAFGAFVRGNMSDFHAANTPGGIEAQEKAGQIKQAALQTLPIEGTTGKDREPWEKFGFKFESNADDLFVNAQFPEGWKKVPTDHSMWSDIVDDKGIKRGSIFYKAAFYDRSAFVRLES